VSFQQLDMNLKEIIKAYPEHKITLLTHEHGVKLAEKYKSINEIVVYPYKQSFSRSRTVEVLKDKDFDIVIIPVTNITGAGFSNVLWFANTIKAQRHVICNLVSNFQEITSLDIVLNGLKNVVFTLLSGILTGIVGLFSVIYLLVMLPTIEKKD
jgi:hypothetical protein